MFGYLLSLGSNCIGKGTYALLWELALSYLVSLILLGIFQLCRGVCLRQPFGGRVLHALSCMTGGVLHIWLKVASPLVHVLILIMVKRSHGAINSCNGDICRVELGQAVLNEASLSEPCLRGCENQETTGNGMCFLHAVLQQLDIESSTCVWPLSMCILEYMFEGRL